MASAQMHVLIRRHEECLQQSEGSGYQRETHFTASMHLILRLYP
jgi:hypothetical protein